MALSARHLITAGPVWLGDLILAGGLGWVLVAFVLPTSQQSLSGFSAMSFAGLIACTFKTFASSTRGSIVHPVQDLRDAAAIAFGTACVSVITGLCFAYSPDPSSFGVDSVVRMSCGFALIATFVFISPLLRSVIRTSFSRSRWWGIDCIIVGNNAMASQLRRFIGQHPSMGWRFQGQFSTETKLELLGSESSESIRGWNRLSEVAQRRPIATAIVIDSDRTSEMLHELHRHVGEVVVVRENELPSLWARPIDLAGIAAIRLTARLDRLPSRIVKRAFDIAASASGILLCLPFFLVIAAWIYWQSPGPILFRHRRIGRDGKGIDVWKLRTMVTDAQARLDAVLASDPQKREEWRRELKLKDDPRVVPIVGPFLRRYSIDELPQLWNVLRGDMSLVGPRPIYTQEEVDKFGDDLRFYTAVRPGLTGLWQVSGRSNTTYEQRVALDRYYVQNWSWSLDLYLLGRTVRTALLAEGAY